MQVSMKTLKYFISNNRRLFLCLVIAAGACCGFVQPTSAQEEASPKGDCEVDSCAFRHTKATVETNNRGKNA